MSKYILFILLLFLTSHINIQAQSTAEVLRKQDSLGLYSPKYGLFFNYNLHTHNVTDFKSIQNDFPLGKDKPFETGSGSSISLGGYYEYPISKSMGVMIRLGYFGMSANFNEQESELTQKKVFDGADTLLVPSISKLDFSIDANISAISIEPLFTVELFNQLNIHAGPNIELFKISNIFSQSEKQMNDSLVPAGSSNARNEYTDKELSSASFQLSLILGASYDIPITDNLFLALEGFYSLPLPFFNVTSEREWKVSTLRFGGAIKFIGDRPCPPGMTRNAQGNCEELPCAPGQIRNEAGECECREGMFVNANGECEWPPCPDKNYERTELGECVQVLYAKVEAQPILSSGLPAETDVLTVKEAESVTYQSLLNYVYFEEGSSNIPEKYVQFPNDDPIVGFKEKDIADPTDPLKTYYNLLNIIGSRLSVNPFATVTLLAYNMGGREANEPDLAGKRIDTISNYLQKIWKVQGGNIQRQIYNLPVDVSRSGDKDLIEEYRRVAIIPDSSNIKIIDPVSVSDIVYRLYPSQINFNIDAIALSSIDTWSLKVFQDDNILFNTTEKQQPPEFVSWHSGPKANMLDPDLRELSYSLEVQDKNGEKRLEEKSMKMKWLRYDPDRKPDESDSVFAMYYLLFNDKDIESDINNNARILTQLNFDKYASKLKITGYTDKTGNAKQNEILSRARADDVKEFLIEKKELSDSRVTTSGLGSVELFDNELPEGRMYNRNVIIDISTPIQEKEKSIEKLTGCVVIIFSDPERQKSETMYNFLINRGVQDIELEEYYMASLEKNVYRVRSKVYEDPVEAVKARAKINVYLRSIELEKQPIIDCEMKDK